jgi:hypothetical protein
VHTAVLGRFLGRARLLIRRGVCAQVDMCGLCVWHAARMLGLPPRLASVARFVYVTLFTPCSLPTDLVLVPRVARSTAQGVRTCCRVAARRSAFEGLERWCAVLNSAILLVCAEHACTVRWTYLARINPDDWRPGQRAYSRPTPLPGVATPLSLSPNSLGCSPPHSVGCTCNSKLVDTRLLQQMDGSTQP